ncbi:MAG: integrin alpha [Planctomycetota bacterium]|nr:integrin alpha [Planctomycetota bacterium]
MTSLALALAAVSTVATGMFYPDDHCLFGGVDLNKDGVGDVVVGLNGYWNAPDHTSIRSDGRLLAFSGKDGSVLFDEKGDQRESLFGTCVAATRDEDGDGTPDLWVGAPGMRRRTGTDARIDEPAGGVQLLSGRNGKVLESLQWQSPCTDAGGAVIVLDDIDGDGRGELGVGTKSGNAMFVCSGKTGTVLWRMEIDAFWRGGRFARTGDMDGDEVDDIVVVSRRGEGQARSGSSLTICSGKTGREIRTLRGFGTLPAGWRYSGGLQPILHAGVQSCLVVCEWPEKDLCRVYLISLVDGSAKEVSTQPSLEDKQFGGSDQACSLGESITLLGTANDADFAVGAPRWSPRSGSGPRGRVMIVSGRDLHPSSVIDPPAPRNMCTSFGDRIASVGDVSGDSVPDIAVFTWQAEDCPDPSPRCVRVYSGGTQKELWRVDLAPFVAARKSE